MLFCLPFADGALKGYFGKVDLFQPPLSTVVKLLCLQHVTEIECKHIQGCEVSFTMRWNDGSLKLSLVNGFHGSRKYIHTYYMFRWCIGAWYIPRPSPLGNIP